jgi:hypothetical protein
MEQRYGVVKDINQSVAYERININTYINEFDILLGEISYGRWKLGYFKITV